MELSEAAKKARRDYNKNWRENNREHINAYNKEWREKNADKRRETMARFWERKAQESKNEK